MGATKKISFSPPRFFRWNIFAHPPDEKLFGKSILILCSSSTFIFFLCHAAAAAALPRSSLIFLPLTLEQKQSSHHLQVFLNPINFGKHLICWWVFERVPLLQSQRD
jgi:hypothetical protein